MHKTLALNYGSAFVKYIFCAAEQLHMTSQVGIHLGGKLLTIGGRYYAG